VSPTIDAMASGVTKEASRTFRGLAHLGGSNRGATDEQLGEEGGAEKTGAVLENIVELMGGHEALKGMSLTGKLQKLSGVARMVEKYPTIARMLGVGVEQGALAGGQTALKTEGDPRATATSALLTAVLSALTEGTVGTVAKFLRNKGATSEAVGGVETAIPGEMRGAEPTPQQATGQQAITNAAQDTLGSKLEEVNESRAVPPSAPGLPEHTGPFEFELRGPKPIETRAGSGVVPAAETPRDNITDLPANPPAGSESARNVEELGSTAATVPARMMRDQPYMTSVAPGAEGETVAMEGGGNVRTQDPNVVRQHISNLNDVIDHEDFDTLPPEQQQQILQARTEAQQQMRQYHDYMKQQTPNYGRAHFPPIDIPKAVSTIGSYTDAANYLENIATDGYNNISDALALNDISGGKFKAIMNANKEAWEAYRGAASEEGLNAAERAIDETNRQMTDLLDNDIGGAVSPKELQGFHDAYRQAQTLKYVAQAVDSSFTGNASSAARSWEYRGFNGRQLMANLSRLEQKMGRQTLERAIGADNLNTLYQVAELNRTISDRAKFGAAVKPIIGWLHQVGFTTHFGPIGVGGLAAHVAGVPWEVGAVGGLTMAAVSRKVMSAILTNPNVAHNLLFAIESGARPQYYGPFIGAMIQRMETDKSDLTQTEPQEQPR
jgi:hypothetical protein